MNDVTEQHTVNDITHSKQSMNENGEKENGSYWAWKNFRETSNIAKI